MRKILTYISFFAFFLILEACEDFLNIQPLDKTSSDVLFANSNGISTVLANIYNKCPIEDFNYVATSGFNRYLGGGDGGTDGGWSIAGATDEAVIDPGGGIAPGVNIFQYWDYTGIRQVNQFLETILSLKSTLTDAVYNQLFGEAHFIRAYMYFQLARRYGGVPLISEVQKLSSSGDNTDLYVPRSTEKETWDFVLAECDLAVANLPTTVTDTYRATKWAALALKSRAALHAASVAKYWNKAPLTGDAVTAKLVGGMTTADANAYYQACITASKDIIDNSGKTLYMPDPGNPTDAAKNYQTMFETPELAWSEIIFMKAYIDGTGASNQQGHNTDFWFYPHQVCFQTNYRSARWGTALNIVDIFEDYTDDGNGLSVPIKTRTDGVENDYASDPRVFDPNKAYQYYDNLSDPFVNKDARLTASVVLPGSSFHGTRIIMQGGLVKSDGTPVVYSDASAVGLDGQTYYTYGSANAGGYSGFALISTQSANYSTTGFALRKFLQDTKNVSTPALHGSTQSWIDFRLAEVYLNYAEAAIESGQGDAALAKTYLNAIRKRAAHTDEIPATIDNILKERRVEFVFEGERYWDLIRRRDFHLLFNLTRRGSLIPIIDLRQNPPKYLFLRAVNYFDEAASGRTFQAQSYYLAIPGIASNLLVQNPGY
jgi:hypothetical protein